MSQLKLSAFLDAYDTIIFDLDGVITSEEMYWNAAALTVYEILNGKHYYGEQTLTAEQMMQAISDIRKEVFCDRKTITALKNIGVNSNWDLAYLVVGMKLSLGENASFCDVLDYFTSFSKDTFTLYQTVAEKLASHLQGDFSHFERLGSFWQDEVVSCFQEWFLGDEYFKKEYGFTPRLSGKSGLMYREEPLVNKEALQILFDLLKASNKRICVGTGRPRLECASVLAEGGIYSCFASDGFVTYDDVTVAQDELFRKGFHINLPKPHPFMFVKACFGHEITTQQIVDGVYDKKISARTLVIGDAGADLYAAKAAGFHFAAVLTGVQGEKARTFFEAEKADYILDSVLDLMREN
ncbi:MAG: HAD family hydrolase [Clostridia bacterium]|nr:HAD family hydrolase [Clostridia bacterium]